MAKITIEYCSSYDSYNGEKVTEGKVLAPRTGTDLGCRIPE